MKTLLWVALAVFWPVVTVFAIGWIRLWAGRHRRFEASLADRGALRKGDIVLVGKRSIFDDWYLQIPNVLTRRLKHRFWVHAAIYDADGCVWEAIGSGVTRRSLDVYAGDYLVAFRHRYLNEPRELEELVAFCAVQRDFHYDYAGLAFFACSVIVPVSFNWLFDNPWIDRRLRLDRAYFCSELVVDAYASIGYRVSPYDGWRVKPSDFIGNPLLVEVHARSTAATEPARGSRSV